MPQPGHAEGLTAFEHRMVAIPGMRLHCVMGGSGPTLVLVAGFPQSCYAWRRVMPLLTPRFRVIAIDLPGQGDSDKPRDGYDTQTTAHRINAALKALNVGRHMYVGHDIGAWVGFAYAHTFEHQLSGIVFLDANIPGVTLQPTLRIAAVQSLGANVLGGTLVHGSPSRWLR